MKEAAGEANMTVVTIVLIAIVLGIGTLIVNNMMTTTRRKSACNSLGGTWIRKRCCRYAVLIGDNQYSCRNAPGSSLSRWYSNEELDN